MQFNLVNNEEQALYLGGVVVQCWRCILAVRRSVHCVLALHCILALYCVVSVVLRLSVALYSSVVLAQFLQAFSVLLLHPYLRCVRSAALVAKVYPLATVSGLLITRASWQYFTVWLAERCLWAPNLHLRRMLLTFI